MIYPLVTSLLAGSLLLCFSIFFYFRIFVDYFKQARDIRKVQPWLSTVFQDRFSFEVSSYCLRVGLLSIKLIKM